MSTEHAGENGNSPLLVSVIPLKELLIVVMRFVLLWHCVIFNPPQRSYKEIMMEQNLDRERHVRTSTVDTSTPMLKLPNQISVL